VGLQNILRRWPAIELRTMRGAAVALMVLGITRGLWALYAHELTPQISAKPDLELAGILVLAGFLFLVMFGSAPSNLNPGKENKNE
jgi:hypothetical protein